MPLDHTLAAEVAEMIQGQELECELAIDRAIVPFDHVLAIMTGCALSVLGGATYAVALLGGFIH